MRQDKSKSRHQQKQYGGMKLGDIANILAKSGKTADIDIINLLMSDIDTVSIVSEKSSYSFVLNVSVKILRLLNPYGLDLQQSVDVPENDEGGKRVNNFCVKITFVHTRGGEKEKKYEYGSNRVTKLAVIPEKMKEEAQIQRQLFELFACHSTTAPFVPDVIADCILTTDQFNAIFVKIIEVADNSDLDTSIAARRIHNWIKEWISDEGISVGIILMEMMDVGRKDEYQEIKPIWKLKSDPNNYDRASICIAAEIAAVMGKKIALHDSHEDNSLSTPTGSECYIIDCGGFMDFRTETGKKKISRYFDHMINQVDLLQQEADAKTAVLYSKLPPTATIKEKLLIRKPSLEAFCKFFSIEFDPSKRKDIIFTLNQEFARIIDSLPDFMCVEPTEENVHSTLMMLALIDFMINQLKYDHPYCQSGETLSVVYPKHITWFDDTNQSYTFRDITSFFLIFCITFKPTRDTRLAQVVQAIKKIVEPCPSQCRLTPNMLRPNWQARRLPKPKIKSVKPSVKTPAAQSVAKVAKTPKSRPMAPAPAPALANQSKPLEISLNAGISKEQEPKTWFSRLASVASWFKPKPKGGTRKTGANRCRRRRRHETNRRKI